MSRITEKQASFIKAIYIVTGYEFKGVTKSEAREYISKNIDEYYKNKDYVKKQLEVIKDSEFYDDYFIENTPKGRKDFLEKWVFRKEYTEKDIEKAIEEIEYERFWDMCMTQLMYNDIY